MLMKLNDLMLKTPENREMDESSLTDRKEYMFYPSICTVRRWGKKNRPFGSNCIVAVC